MRVETLPALDRNYNLQHYTKVKETFQWEQAYREFSWHSTGKVNMAYEAIDKHAELETRKDKIALQFYSATRRESYTFFEMKKHSNRVANVLKDAGVEKGDHVFTLLPRCPELYFAIFGTLKVGAIIGPLFEAFMAGAIYERLFDSDAKVIITTTELLAHLPIDDLPKLQFVFVIGEQVVEEGKIRDYTKRTNEASQEFTMEWLTLEDGMLLQYTSGYTGEPKGVYLSQQAMVQYLVTAKWVLDLQEDDVLWCTADPGWMTGMAYGVFAPWLAGITNVVYGGTFSPTEWYETIERHQVTVWYSAPTAFRMLMGAGDELAKNYDLRSLRHILSVGEPLNPEEIRWGMKVFNVRIHDTWWMTETGAMMIANFPSIDIKPGSMGKAIPGINAAIVNDEGEILPPNHMGNIAIRGTWPAMLQKIWNDDERYKAYFTKNGWFLSGDSGYIDEDGYFWFQGRVDDVTMSSGEQVGPFEIESVLLEHPAVAEVGVIGRPDPEKGEVIKAYISLRDGYTPTPNLEQEIKKFVQQKLTAQSTPEEIEFRDKLPKTRSGKIMRRVLKSWELNVPSDKANEKS